MTTADTLFSGGAPKNPTVRTADRDFPVDVPRDRWQRPLIVSPSGGERMAYTRASTLGGTLEDQYNLGLWRARMVARGVALRRDLALQAQSLRTVDAPEDKKALDQIAERALEAAEASSKATIGTALHAITDRFDSGERVEDLGEFQATLDAYAEVAAGFTMHQIEQFVVCDELTSAGTFDRLVSPKADLVAPDGTVFGPGERLIWDLKCLALDTPIPTPSGWSTMDQLQRGDLVFGSDGRPCRVTAKSAAKNVPTYVVTFTGGDQIVCDREHLWWVMSGREESTFVEQVLSAQQIKDTLFRYGQRWHRVPMAKPLELPDADLPIDPYLLGCWLGDGTRSDGSITKQDDLFEVLAADGHSMGLRRVRTTSVGSSVQRTVHGLHSALRIAGILGHKVIPDGYLRASRAQREALLQGLMDTDGSWNIERERAVFAVTDKALAEQVGELCLSLGLRPQRNAWQGHGFGKDVTVYGVEFRPSQGFNPFRLPRKADKVTWNTSDIKSRYRVIQSVESGPDVETACIAVSSPNQTYLCGRDMIPTHNTSSTAQFFGIKFAVQLAVYAYGVPYSHEHGRSVWQVAPNRFWALICHAPSGGSTAALHWVDLAAGWELAQLACTVRDWRKDKTLVRPAIEVPKPRRAAPAPPGSAPKAIGARLQVVNALRRAESRDAMLEIRRQAVGRQIWTPDMDDIARARLRELPPF